MAIFLETIPYKKIKLIKSIQIICHDKTHLHNSPIQNMVTLEINQRIVEITQDGDFFNARVDEQNAQFGITFDQLTQYIKDNT